MHEQGMGRIATKAACKQCTKRMSLNASPGMPPLQLDCCSMQPDCMVACVHAHLLDTKLRQWTVVASAPYPMCQLQVHVALCVPDEQHSLHVLLFLRKDRSWERTEQRLLSQQPPRSQVGPNFLCLPGPCCQSAQITTECTS